MKPRDGAIEPAGGSTLWAPVVRCRLRRALKTSAPWFGMQGSTSRKSSPRHSRDQRPGFHCRLLIADCRLKKWCGNSFQCPSAIGNRKSAIPAILYGLDSSRPAGREDGAESGALSRDFQERGCGVYTLTCLRFQNRNPGFILKTPARRLIPCHGLL